MAKFKPQYRRLLFIDRKIREGNYPNCRSLGEEWEVSPKTIQRDIDYIRYELDAPVEYDSARHGYCYTEESYRLPAMNISESDLFAVCIAERALKQFEDTPLYDKLVSVFGKIENALPDKLSIHPAWVDNRIFFFPEPSTTINPGVWEIVATALRDNRRLRITYRGPGKKKAADRDVEPYHLVNFKGEWYLSSFCCSKQAIRTFAVSRIVGARALSESFVMPEKFDREKMFGDQFGIIWKEESYKVRIRFDVNVAPYIVERDWHPQQKIVKRKDGSIVLEFVTNHISEVKKWVLSWGPGARVLAPPFLVEAITSDLAHALNMY